MKMVQKIKCEFLE